MENEQSGKEIVEQIMWKMEVERALKAKKPNKKNRTVESEIDLFADEDQLEIWQIYGWRLWQKPTSILPLPSYIGKAGAWA